MLIEIVFSASLSLSVDSQIYVILYYQYQGSLIEFLQFVLDFTVLDNWVYYFDSFFVNFGNGYYSSVVIGNNFSVCFDNLNFCFVKYCVIFCDNYQNLIFDSLICYSNSLVICYVDFDDFHHLNSFCSNRWNNFYFYYMRSF